MKKLDLLPRTNFVSENATTSTQTGSGQREYNMYNLAIELIM